MLVFIKGERLITNVDDEDTDEAGNARLIPKRLQRGEALRRY